MLEEECESSFSAERILGALLKATRAKSHLENTHKASVKTEESENAMDKNDNTVKTENTIDEEYEELSDYKETVPNINLSTNNTENI